MIYLERIIQNVHLNYSNISPQINQLKFKKIQI